ncbi:MAG TPA: hypothetical protein VI316_09150 [Candidatus Dormibacteraeota bacterium]
MIVIAPAAVSAHQHFFVTVDVNFPLQIRIPMGAVIPGTGHFHFFIDRPPFPPGVHTPDIGLPGIIHSITERTLIPGLDPGTHTITVTLADGLDDTSDEVPPVSVTVIVR